MSFLDEVPWNGDGLIAAVAQDSSTGRVLTVAWMNRDALKETVDSRRGGLLVALAQEAVAQGRGVGQRAESASRCASIAIPTPCC